MDMQSYITLSANAPNCGTRRLPPPEYVEAVRDVPKEITGVERRYLEALQKNVRARREYNVLLQKPAQQAIAPQVEVRGTRLSEHVELLRLKKRHAELQILQRYMTKLENAAAARPGVLNVSNIQRCDSGSLSSGYQHPNGGIDRADDSADALVRKLEMAVIRAEYQVSRERKLLAEVEQEVDAVPSSLKQGNRTRALAATRDVLVAWMEDKLSSSPSNEKDMPDDALQEQQIESPLPQLQSEIMSKYDHYVQMRQKMLDLISLTADAQHSHPPLKPQTSETKSKINPPTPTSHPPPLHPSILPFILTQIHSPTLLHQSHRRQTTHLTSLLKTQRSETASFLSRLADESHLLPTYPMLAREDRFKHATAAFASKLLVGNVMTTDDGGENEMSRRVEAWAFAADAAKEATEEIVKGCLERGGEAVREGEGWVAWLRHLLGDDVEPAQNEEGGSSPDAGEDDADEDEDVWTQGAGAAVGSLRRIPRKQAEADAEAGKGRRGPWTGLKGDVALRKDTVQMMT